MAVTDQEQVPIPTQEEGRQSDIVEQRSFATAQLAREAFLLARNRLLDINYWGRISAGLSADFSLLDETGNKLERAPLPKDFIRIDLPGPGSLAGHGYDWVQIEAVEESEADTWRQAVLLRVRPSQDPSLPEGPAHFFDPRASSTFLLERTGQVLRAGIHGRNEQPAVAAKKIDTLRNTVVSELAALGAAAIQWKKLANAILGIDDAGNAVV